MEYPKNYEEAKKIIIECNSDEDYNKKLNKTEYLRVGLISTVFLGIAILYGVVSKDINCSLAVLPFGGLITCMNLLPGIKFKKMRKDIADGSFFEKNDEKRVMEIAREYVKTYNQYLNVRMWK